MSVKVRIKFSKLGAMKYIGHLDLMRYFQKVIRRSGVDIAYSEGFSPHQKLSFALALGVGVESLGEYMDMDLNSLDSTASLMERMNRENVEGIRVTKALILPERSANAMSEVAAASYEVYFEDESLPEGMDTEALKSSLYEAVKRFARCRDFPVIKETKKKKTELNLKEHVFELVARPEINGLYMKLSAGSVVNIKPDMMISSLFSLMDEPDLENVRPSFRRMDIYGTGLKALIP